MSLIVGLYQGIMQRFGEHPAQTYRSTSLESWAEVLSGDKDIDEVKIIREFCSVYCYISCWMLLWWNQHSVEQEWVVQR
jgi:hypothetical protein